MDEKMSKLFYLFTLIFISSCITNTKNNNVLTYQSFKELKVNVATREDVIKKFGQPGEVENNSDGTQTFYYYDKVKKYQRISLNIDTSNNILINNLWIPFPNEKESEIDGALSGFDKESFKEFPDPSAAKAHYISSMLYLIDKKNGITILYNKRTKYVDAIGFTSYRERSTSSQ